MDKVEKIEELYQRKFYWIPEGIHNEIGHFNVFRLEPYVGDKANTVPYKRRDYYKITQIIVERILQESKILLKHSAWSVSEIAYALGFTEVTHFNNFFKKQVQLSPLKFRNI